MLILFSMMFLNSLAIVLFLASPIQYNKSPTSFSQELSHDSIISDNGTMPPLSLPNVLFAGNQYRTQHDIVIVDLSPFGATSSLLTFSL